MKPDLEEILRHAQKLLQKGNNDDAQLLLAEVIKFDPENRAALMMLGGSYFSKQAYGAAVDTFQQLAALVPGDGKASAALFNCYWKQGKQELALDEIKRFIAVADKTRERETIEQYLQITQQFGK